MKFSDYYLKENEELEDLIIDNGNGNKTIYRVSDIDLDEFKFIEKMYNKEKSIKVEPIRWITKDTKKEQQVKKAREKFISNYEKKIKPWMIKVLNSKGIKYEN